MNQGEYGDWPYDPHSEQVVQEQLRDRLRMEEDLKEAWALILDYLPTKLNDDLKAAIGLIEGRL